jgi:hypothetical protein
MHTHDLVFRKDMNFFFDTGVWGEEKNKPRGGGTEQ